jgi:hypothetical protein
MNSLSVKFVALVLVRAKAAPLQASLNRRSTQI